MDSENIRHDETESTGEFDKNVPQEFLKKLQDSTEKKAEEDISEETKEVPQSEFEEEK